ncbi:HMG domain-containing protein 4 isoform X1 [Hyperolius riggenbachi]|uniref:HMG domain-containing protein 4 isoform X1 n=2 Tax=Hyperolius riggenbachi TaxID=752182 RepID=UPI0035A383C3
MAYRDSRGSLDADRGMDDVGLAAGRSQREKKRSYKDLLREEEEIAEQVRKSSKKRPKDAEFTPPVPESHKKKKKHSEETHHTELSSSDSKKKKKHGVSGSSSSSDTAMDLLNSISSPVVSSSRHSSKRNEKTMAPPVQAPPSRPTTRKEHRKKGGEDAPEDLSTKSKKPKPLTLREPEGLRMKLILSPKEKSSESQIPTQESPSCSDKSSSKKSSKKSKDETEKSSHKKHKKESHTSRRGGTPESASSSGADADTGQLVVDDSLRELMKKKKKSKKSKKKKDKHKEEKHKKHSKSKKEHAMESPKPAATPVLSPPPPATAIAAVVTASPPPVQSPPAVAPQPTPILVPLSEGASDKKKKKEDPEKNQPKKKNMSAYQVFSKEYRGSIVAEHPGLDFGELSKKLAEVWKQLPEKDKLVWKQKAQYLQHKQNKAEATTVKRKGSPSESSSKSKGSPSSSGLSSPHKKSPSIALSSSSPAKVPDTEPIDVAAHLQLLGESLSLIGHRLQETEVMITPNPEHPGMVAVSGSLSVLLDSILCALGPLVCLTSHVPQLNSCPKQVLSNTLDNIAYVMPGL